MLVFKFAVKKISLMTETDRVPTTQPGLVIHSSLFAERFMLEIVPCRHLSLVPNIETYFIFPAWIAMAMNSKDCDGTEQLNIIRSSPLGISIQPIAFAEIIVGFGCQWSSN